MWSVCADVAAMATTTTWFWFTTAIEGTDSAVSGHSLASSLGPTLPCLQYAFMILQARKRWAGTWDWSQGRHRPITDCCTSPWLPLFSYLCK